MSSVPAQPDPCSLCSGPLTCWPSGGLLPPPVPSGTFWRGFPSGLLHWVRLRPCVPEPWRWDLSVLVPLSPGAASLAPVWGFLLPPGPWLSLGLGAQEVYLPHHPWRMELLHVTGGRQGVHLRGSQLKGLLLGLGKDLQGTHLPPTPCPHATQLYVPVDISDLFFPGFIATVIPPVFLPKAAS